jgi:hypothetical protein
MIAFLPSYSPSQLTMMMKYVSSVVLISAKFFGLLDGLGNGGRTSSELAWKDNIIHLGFLVTSRLDAVIGSQELTRCQHERANFSCAMCNT